jgi:hypothetical protein
VISEVHVQPIYVEELNASEEMRLELKALSHTWSVLAIERLNSTKSESEIQTYNAARIVNLVTFQRTCRITNFKRTFSSVICYGIDLNIRGFALVKPIMLPIEKSGARSREHPKRFVHLNYLSSDPNILFDKREWKGIGFSLIHFLFEKCIRENFAGVFVEPLSSAEPFFTHLGFSVSDTTGSTKRAMIWMCSTNVHAAR